MALDVQDAQVPQRPWMAESGPGEIDSKACNFSYHATGTFSVSPIA
jgi:hypothetical protein